MSLTFDPDYTLSEFALNAFNQIDVLSKIGAPNGISILQYWTHKGFVQGNHNILGFKSNGTSN